MGNRNGKLAERRAVDSNEDNITTTDEAFVPAQTPVKSNLPISVTLRQQVNVKTPYALQFIWDCIKIGNALVFPDNNNYQLIICNSDGKHRIPLPCNPYYITEVNGSVSSKISTICSCWGISCIDNNLYVVIEWFMIHVIEVTGKVKRTILLPSNIIRHITVDRDRLVCIDYTSIYCCSLDGTLIWKFKNYNYQDLRGVTTDGEGYVYVNNGNTNSVVEVFGDGQNHREILTGSDGLNRPRGIYFDKKENILLVCNYRDGKAFLFDVNKELT
ncbi:unnamed protein product [Mytilus coruscus]|uniref:TRIM2_3 n=1 Tax=Mytilus coruscus TaxID=42192 RepID=A0A6J8DE99_MYTCO|nr:unnamed protein product [Mytilus coruscus]